MIYTTEEDSAIKWGSTKTCSDVQKSQKHAESKKPDQKTEKNPKAKQNRKVYTAWVHLHEIIDEQN